MSLLHRVSSLFVLGVFAVGCSSGTDGGGTTPGEDTGTSEEVGGDGAVETDTGAPGDTASDSSSDTAVSPDTGPVDTGSGDTGAADTDGVDAGSADTADGGSGDTCAATCTVGTKVCDGTQVRECVLISGCPALSAALPCPSGSACSGGVCSPTCTDACTTVGATKCSGTNVQTCELKSSGCKDWSLPSACPSPKTCSGEACVLTCTDACTAGTKRCGAGDTVETCEMKTTGCTGWSTPVACAAGQSCTGAGVCTTCTTGAKRCTSTGNVETCTSGTWLPTTACSFGCTAGACVSSVSCTPGAYRCTGNAVEICNSSGSAWLYNSTCAVACSAGLCTGACTPGAKRCNGSTSETCNGAGTAWESPTTCSSVCDPGTGRCALAALTIDPTTTASYDGEIVVDGVVTVKAGSTLKSDSGSLTIRAKSIVVETGGSIVVAANGDYGVGIGGSGAWQSSYFCGGGYYSGGYYGGSGGTYSSSGATDALIGPGSRGGNGAGGAAGGKGGGVLRLVADTISVAGTITANGANGAPASSYSGGGGGSGGGILLAANSLTVSGVVNAVGGSGGAGPGSCSNGSNGGNGRVKLLHGSTKSITGTIAGQKTEAILPPLQVTSSTHPDPNLIYNDDFGSVALTWNRAFPSVLGYYAMINTSASNVPTPSNAVFVEKELTSYLRSAVVAGSNYFHIASIDSMSSVGTVENIFRIQVNTTPPTVTSSSHPSQTTWSSNNTVFYAWTLPSADVNHAAYYYVLDHKGRTVPTKTDTMLPVTQKSLIRSALVDGVWGFHVVSVDQRGYLTKQAGHYRARIGADPGVGSITGTVSSGGSNITGATVTINDGLFDTAAEAPDQATNTAGAYSFPAKVPAGTWDVTVTKAGYKPKTLPVTVTAAATATLNVTLDPI